MLHSSFIIHNFIPTSRFAPSPTGLLHLGHAYAAKVAYDLAKQYNGTFLLRQEDIDSSRVRAEYYQQIEDDLLWLGLPWDGKILLQSQRQSAYDQALETLNSLGLIYPCFCTRKEIEAEIRRSLGAPHAPNDHPYPGTCRNLPPEEAELRIQQGHPHSWRFHSSKAAEIHGLLTFNDLRHGTIPVDPSINGDAILSRKDIGTAYHLAVVIDDAFQNITHVTRGEDLLPSTHIHRQLQAILQLPEPTYLHHPLILDEKGNRLAKRDNARSIQSLRHQGLSPGEIYSRMPATTTSLST